MILIPVSKNKQVVAGFAILKKTTIERKICTFRISNGYRGIGYGDKAYITSSGLNANN